MATFAPLTSSVRLVGAEPWLPWPLSAWRWWTEPVAAERLAALRIGLALFLLFDILGTYLPNLEAFFLDGGPGGSRIFAWYTREPRWTWSILRGLGDPLIYTLIAFAWLGATLGVVLDWFARSTAMIGVKWRIAWLALGIALVGSSWEKAWDQTIRNDFFWLAPTIVAGVALAAMAIEMLFAMMRRTNQSALILAAVACYSALGLLTLGAMLEIGELDKSWLRSWLGPWQGDLLSLQIAAVAWAVSTALLAVGCLTRTAAFVTWALSTSFANLNPNIDNAGDVIRGIILFYLMLCPCGAVWSSDRLWQRRRGGGNERIVVSPWALRLLFVQLVFIYFMNGLYKLGGESWMSGDSLHYVLCDVTLTRFWYAQFPLPLWLTQLSTWLVLGWEVGFPLLVCNRWTRTPALIFGVLFHLGIYVTMELGNFVPYVLTMYLPLLPWERLGRRSTSAVL